MSEPREMGMHGDRIGSDDRPCLGIMTYQSTASAGWRKCRGCGAGGLMKGSPQPHTIEEAMAWDKDLGQTLGLMIEETVARLREAAEEIQRQGNRAANALGLVDGEFEDAADAITTICDWVEVRWLRVDAALLRTQAQARKIVLGA